MPLVSASFSKHYINEIDHVVFYEKPFEKFDRIIETVLAFAPRGANNFVKSCHSGPLVKSIKKRK